MGTKRWVFRLRRISGDKKVGLQGKEDQWGPKRWVFKLRRTSGDKRWVFRLRKTSGGQKGRSSG